MQEQMYCGKIGRRTADATVSRAKKFGTNRRALREKQLKRPLIKGSLLSAILCGVALLFVGCLSNRRSSDWIAQQFQSVTSLFSEETSRSAMRLADASQAPVNSQLFEGEQQPIEVDGAASWLFQASKVTLRLLLASLLAAMLAFRPHRNASVLRRNPYVTQTQILLAVVASALMMFVADNAARAFGIFAAASLVRFRTNIRDPKEITVLLINLAIGLATGVGRFELAVILSVFVLASLWVLELYESKQVVRSMRLKVKTHDVGETDGTLRNVFERNNLTAEVRELDREDDQNPLGRIVYYLVGPQVSTDQLSDEIFAADPNNVDSVEWHQKKSESYTYR